MKNKINKILVWAYNKGYRVNEFGEPMGLRGNKLYVSYTNKGYGSFNVRYEGKVTRVFLHRLQAYQKYHTKIFEDGIMVRHLDGNSKNNSVTNIKIGNQSDNMMDIPKKKRVLNASNPKHNHEEVIKMIDSGMTYKEITKLLGISKGTISYINNKSLKRKGIK